MQKWEYLEIDRTGNRVVEINGKDATSWEGGVSLAKPLVKNFYEFVEQLGKEGWELVTVSQVYHYYFKRQLQE
jgi:hypothetical protein